MDSVVRINVLITDNSSGETRILGGGNGSGIVVDAAGGFVLTNAHVVDRDGLVFIEAPGGDQVRATIVGTDLATDLALLQADISGVRTARFADSALLQPGDLVFAIGFPRGLEKTISSGVVSGVNRQGFRDVGSGRFGVDEFIQTDASVNPGNSGGPLVDSAGRVVGVNTFIASQSGDSAGLGFAVPSRVAVAISRQLREHGRVRRTFIGLQVDSLEAEAAGELGVDVTSGALVTRVMPGSPADLAGLEAGDVITGVDSERIDNDTDFINFWLLSQPGARYPVFVRRGAQALRLTLSPTPLESRDNPAAALSQGGDSQFLGAVLTDPPRDLNGSHGVAGARVAFVPDGSAAADRGLRAGDLILEANRRPVRSSEQLISYARDHHGVIILRVRRGAETIIVLTAS